MKIDDACLVERTVQLIDVVGKLDAVMGYDVRCTRHRGGGIIAVLGDFVTCTGNDKTAGGRDVEGVLAVATCTYHVDVAVGVEDGRDTSL